MKKLSPRQLNLLYDILAGLLLFAIFVGGWCLWFAVSA
jgi:hypothetical protein